MIHLFTAPTPNGHKISIALEELGLPYTVNTVNILRGEQFQPEFLRISPNNRIPAILDDAGPPDPSGGAAPLPLFESGAILLYLAERYGGQDGRPHLLPADPRGRYEAIQWLMWQMGGFGPMLGQAHHFRKYAPEPIPYAIERYTKEAARLYGVLDRRLAEAEYLAGAYSVADIACWPWARAISWQGQDMDAFPNVKRWYLAIKARPAVQAGIQKPEAFEGTMDAEAKRVMFGIQPG